MEALRFFENFVQLFESLGIVGSSLLICGLILVSCEMFQPCRGILFSCGSLLLSVSILVALMQNGNIVKFFIMLVVIFTFVILAYLLSLYTNKRRWLVEIEKSAPTKEILFDKENTYSFLIGEEALAVTDIFESGQIMLNDIIISALANGQNIVKGDKVRITEVVGNQIIVDKCE